MAADISSLNVKFSSTGYRTVERQMDTLQRKGDKLERDDIDVKFSSAGLSQVERDIERIKKLSRGLNRDSSINVASTGISRVLRHVKLLKERLNDLEGKYTVRINGAGTIREATNAIDANTSAKQENSQATDSVGAAIGRVLKNTRALLSRFRLIAFVFGTATAAAYALSESLIAVGTAAAGIAVSVGLESMVQRLRSASGSAKELATNIQSVFNIVERSGLGIFGSGAAIGKALTAGISEQTLQGLTVAMSAFGLSTADAVKYIEQFTEQANAGGATVDELLKSLEFTNDPLQALANSLGVSVDRIKALQEQGSILTGTLDDIAGYLGSNAKEATNVTDAWNRLVLAFAELMRSFNQTGAMQSFINLLNDITDWLRSGEANRLIQRLAQDFINFATVTLPNTVSWIRENWRQIVRVFEISIGILIGGAAGGIWGALIGAIIGGSDTLQTVLGKMVVDIGSLFGSFSDDLSTSKNKVVDWSDTLIRAFGYVADSVRASFMTIGTLFKTVGTTIAAGIAQIQMFLKGDIAGGMAIGGQWLEDQKQIWDNYLDGNFTKYRDFIDNLIDQNKRLGKEGPVELKPIVVTGDGLSFSGSSGMSFSPNGFGVNSGESGGISSAARQAEAFQKRLDSIIQGAKYTALMTKMSESTKRVGEAWSFVEGKAKQANDNMSEFARRAASNIQDTLGTTLERTLKGSFDSILDLWLNTITRMATQAAAADLGKALLGDFGKSGDIGGLIGKGIGALAGAFGFGNTGTAMNMSGYTVNIPKFHTGGIVGSESAASKIVNMEAFKNAKRFHSGGMIGPGEVPIVAREGEGVFTPAQMRNLGPSGDTTVNNKTEINVTYQEAEGKTPNERDTDRGQFMRDLEQTVKGVMLKDVAERGEFSRGLQGVYGLKRQGAA